MRMFTACTTWRYVLVGLFLVGGCGRDGSDPATHSQEPVVNPPPPVPVLGLVTLDFSGTFGGGGMATGSFTYDKTAPPQATDVRGLAPNATYPLTAWTFTVTGGAILPSSIFMNGVPGHSAEFCVGTCVFSAAPVIELSFLNDAGLLLQLTFDLLDPTPLTSPPADLSEWGGIEQSLYRIPCPVCVPVAIFNAGTLTVSP
jgi:hypothetical protein